MKVTVKAIVPQTPDVVFDFVADMHNDVQWAPLVNDVVQVAGERPGLGATYRYTQHLGSHRLELESTIVAYERPGKLGWTIDHKALVYDSTIHFEAHARGTRIIQTTRERWTYAPWWLRIAGPHLVKRQLRRQLALLGQALAKEGREEENVQAYLDSNSA